MKWEYLVETIGFKYYKDREDLKLHLEPWLNQLGGDGWELIVLVPTAIPGYSPEKDNLESVAIFKRQGPTNIR
jgi:hypothetical protein